MDFKQQHFFLMRHGEAEDYSPTGDSGRILTSFGAQKIEKIAEFIRKYSFTVEQLWVSPYSRTQQTAQIIEQALSLQQKNISLKDSLIPSGSVKEIADELSFSEENIWLVSHLPFIPNLASELLGSRIQLNMTPGSILHLSRFSFGQVVIEGFYSADFICNSIDKLLHSLKQIQ